jgi:aminotransferase in exopolysaccharide biosynthesis
MNIPFCKYESSRESHSNVSDVLDGDNVDQVKELESDFMSYIGCKYALATSHGTSALHLAMLALDLKRGDKVVCSVNAHPNVPEVVRHFDAEPIFIDINRNTLGLSHKALKKFLEKYCVIKDKKCINKTTNKIIKACIPMHTFGHPCKIDEIKKICDKWHIVLVEDSAESLGSYYKNKHTGTFGKLGIFSFNGNKIITSGGGGVIVTNNEELAKKAKYLTTTAKIPHKWEYKHDSIGYNYRMPNLNASLLVAQLEQLNKFLKNKRELAKKYKKFFKNYDDIDFIKEPKNSKSNYWLNGIIFKNKKQRDKFLKFSNKQGIMTRPIWQPLNQLNMYKDCQCDSLKNTKYLSKTVVNISSSVI